MTVIINTKILPHATSLPLPTHATEHSAGIDLFAAIAEEIIIKPSQVQIIPTGIVIALPEGYEAQIRPRSGLAAKHAVTVLNSPGTIDADYRGEIKVILINHSNQDFVITHGMRIAQMVVAKYSRSELKVVSELKSTTRGEQGFGSTGTHILHADPAKN